VTEPVDLTGALHLLDVVVRILLASAAVTLAAVLYGIWRWHRSKWQ